MDERYSEEGFLVADKDRFERTVHRLADRVYARLDDPPVIIGIRRRGVPLAEAMAVYLEKRHDWPLTVGEITLKRYRDDLTILHQRPKLAEDSLTVDVEEASVLLVDDVLYTGRTLLRAAEFLLEAGAGEVNAAVLSARDRPEVPVAATFIGLRLDVGPGNAIEVEIPPYEDRSGIRLMHQ
jgi:pyrimidine operon attenuation protein/uracil phosphoribosyltransferase